MTFTTIRGLRILEEQTYCDAMGYVWWLLYAAWTSERVADRPPFWTYYDIDEELPTVNTVGLRIYATREAAIAALEADAPRRDREREKARRERERFRADTILQAMHRINDPPHPSTRVCPWCHRRGYYDVSFKRNPWSGICDECQAERDKDRRQWLGEE